MVKLLPYRDGTETVYKTLNKLSVIDLENTTGLSAAINKPSIRMVHSNTDGHVRVDEKIAVKDRPLGFVIFVPAGAHAIIESMPYDVTIICMCCCILEEAAGRRVKFDRARAGFKPRVSHLVNAVREIAKDSENTEPILQESAKIALVSAVVCEITPGLLHETDGQLKRCAYRRVAGYIEENYQKPISLSELASAACMSRFAFARAWRQATGTTPMQFLLARRVEHAKRMLAQGNVPVLSVAIACGFCSHSHFTTVFTRITGETPTAYRLRMSR